MCTYKIETKIGNKHIVISDCWMKAVFLTQY